MPHYLHKRIKILIGVFMFLCFQAGLFAQGRFTINGTISDETGSPLIGANVILKGTSIGTITDIDGVYNLSGNITDGNYEIVVSYIGYSNATMRVDLVGGGKQTLDFTLSSDALFLDEVVVTGNTSTTTRRQLGNSISVVKADDISKAGTTNALGALQGKVMGAQISQNSGDPAGGISVRLRGASSING